MKSMLGWTAFGVFGFSVLIGLPACSTGSNGNSVDELIADYNQTVEAINSEIAAHKSTIAGLSSIDDIHEEESRHAEAMGPMMEELDQMSQEIDACDGMEMASSMMDMDYDSMESMYSDMMSEVEEHTESMGNTEDMEEAQALEDAYQAAMDDMMSAMEDQADEMSTAEMMCE